MTPRIRNHRHRTAPAFFGLLLVVWGVFALLSNLGFVQFREIFRAYWPLLIIAWGVSRLASRRGDRWFGVLAIVVGGIFLGNQWFGWHVNSGALWSLLPIFFGLRIMFRSRRERWPHGVRVHVNRMETAGGTGSPSDPAGATSAAEGDAADESATLREFALLGGVERRNTSQTFRGGEVTAVLGGVEIDLRECRMADAEAHLDVLACMGGISLRIPRDWTVESRVEAILGGFDDQSTPPVDGGAKRLVIRGQAIMGGIEIKN